MTSIHVYVRHTASGKLAGVIELKRCQKSIARSAGITGRTEFFTAPYQFFGFFVTTIDVIKSISKVAGIQVHCFAQIREADSDLTFIELTLTVRVKLLRRAAAQRTHDQQQPSGTAQIF
jgi:hypothetical protein